jgi:hypothetical protein
MSPLSREYSPERSAWPDPVSPVSGLKRTQPRRAARARFCVSFMFQRPSLKLRPFTPRCCFWPASVTSNSTEAHPGFLLQTVTSFQWSGLHRYYGLICHLAPRRFFLSFPLDFTYPSGTIQGFPSYLGLPVNGAILKHHMGLIRYRALRHFARLPSHEAESGSLALCAVHLLSLPSDPTVASDALAIRIVFPLIGATPASFSRPGLPATLGKHRVG